MYVSVPLSTIAHGRTLADPRALRLINVDDHALVGGVVLAHPLEFLLRIVGVLAALVLLLEILPEHLQELLGGNDF